jgi:hypothetical protein
VKFYIGLALIVTIGFWTWVSIIWSVERSMPHGVPRRFMEVGTAFMVWPLVILFVLSIVSIANWMTKP